MGTARMFRGERPLVRFRSAANEELCRQVMDAMVSLQSDMESIDLTLQREVAYCQYMYGWQTRFGHLVGWFVVGPPTSWKPYENLHELHDRRIAIHRLLMTEFGIQRYQLAVGKLPDSLEALTPYLPQSPLDPFTGRAFNYRNNGESFLLYSVGPDGNDDGGQFTTLRAHASQRGFDLDVETLIRGETMYAN
jgi:hypothetical protein